MAADKAEVSAQKEFQIFNDTAEVIALCCEYGVDGVAHSMGEEVSAHAVIFFATAEVMADHRFDGGSSLEGLF